MTDTRSLELDDFDPAVFLKAICKEGDHLQVDFLALDKELGVIQSIQERTCEQIVEFVDQHREKFIAINGQLGLIEDKVHKSQVLLTQLGSKTQEYKAGYYLRESRIQRCINEYELKLMAQRIAGLAKSQAAFLLRFNLQFDSITCREVSELTLTQKYLVSRFTRQIPSLRLLFQHPVLIQQIPDTLNLGDTLTNLSEEFEFYLSQQLAKYQLLSGRPNLAEEQQKRLQNVLALIRSWYCNLGRKEEYYQVLQRNSIQRELQGGQKLLIASKTSLLSGKDQPLLDSVFARVLASAQQFPNDYPRGRLSKLLFGFFRKEELKFLYTYAMPIFPIAYRSYLNAVEAAKLPEWLRAQLKEHHGWNLKMWVMVRQKNIIDRSAGDSDLVKWIDIIFKQTCLLPGVIPDFVRLVFRLLHRYLSKLPEFAPASFNRLLQMQDKAPVLFAQKLKQAIGQSQHSLINRCVDNVRHQLNAAVREVAVRGLRNVGSSCVSSLEPVKSFVSKIIKKDKEFLQQGTVNKHESLFKPLSAFLKNNQELSPEALNLLTVTIEEQVVKHFDSQYVPDIYAYSKDHLVSEQVSLVMEVVGRERTTLFPAAIKN